jgi:hypothetical protein
MKYNAFLDPYRLLGAMILVFAGLILFGGYAHAQSSPGFNGGETPSAAQWNGYFAGKWDYPGNIGPNLIMAGPASPSAPPAAPAFRALTVSDLPPITNLQQAVYVNTGPTLANTHIVTGSITIGISTHVTLAGNAAYTSSSSYVCAGTDQTTANPFSLANQTGTQFNVNGTLGDMVNYICVGS